MAKRKKNESAAAAGPQEIAKITERMKALAKEAGYNDEQIAGYEDADALKAAVLLVRPELAAGFNEPEPEPEPKERKFIKEIETFETSFLPGYGPISSLAAKEQKEIDRQIRRRGIRNITKIRIERNLVAAEDGRVHSKIMIEYRKEA
jgi:hypothetical protein